MLFSELQINPEILRAIEEMGFTEATDIQSGAIPPILDGRDVTGRSSTGTGKTAAFGIPAVQMAAEGGKASVLVLCPTRELAVQTAGEVRKLAKYVPSVSVATVYGGQPMDLQIRQLKTAKIVIGTPGRVMDHMRRKTLRLDNLRTIVLDEADEMLNMGFIDDIRTVLESAPPTRQTVLFSATMPAAILKITQDFQTEPAFIAVDGGQKTVANIAQSYYNIPQGGKNDTLKLLIEYHRPKRSLVFCNTKRMVDELVQNLSEGGFRVAGLHGDLKQNQRNAVMADFKSGRINILVATDVAARGIDVDDVEAVFNYDIPQEYEYYIHRIGRTGRAGKLGASYTLAANRGQVSRVREIERYIGAHIEEKEVPSLESIAQHRSGEFAADVRRMVDENEGYEWLKFIEQIENDGYDARAIAAALCAKLQNKNKRLASVRNVRAIVSGTPKNTSFGHKSTGDRVWLRVDIGSDAKIGPNFIVGAIVEGTGLSASNVGKINIYAGHTDIEMAKADAETVLADMQNAKIKQQRVSFSLVEEKTAPYRAARPFEGKGGSKNWKGRPYDKARRHKD
ncbi:MAG: DEAD/DEAH box helicase [Oscillospiraceae bacterium]